MTGVDEIVAALRSSPAFHIATVSAEGKPHVRPFNFVMEYRGHLAFCTKANKAFYAQLQSNPYVEISVYNDTSSSWWRVHGKVNWIDDHPAKEKVFDVMPWLKGIYEGPNDPLLRVFWVAGAADFYSFANQPENVAVRTVLLN